MASSGRPVAAPIDVSTAFAIAALAFCAVAPLHAAPPAAPDPTRASEGVRVMVRADGLGSAADAPSLASALARSPELDAILVAPAGMELVEAAARAGCAIAVGVTGIDSGDGKARSDWRIVDPFDGSVIESGSVQGYAPTERDLADFWWLPVVDAVERAVPSLKKPILTVMAEPGTVVTGLTAEPLVVPDAGRAELSLRVPGTYPWRATAAGAYPERGVFDALENGAEMTVPRRALRRWSVEAGMLMTQYPDIYGSWRFLEDRLFLRFGLSQYMVGLYLGDATNDEPWGIVTAPLIQPGAGVGIYALPPDVLVRPYLATTAFARVIGGAGLPLALDPVGPLGVSASAGAEWALTARLAMFMELGATFYPCPDGVVFAATRGGSDSGPTTSAHGDGWYMELPLFRFGARVTP